MTNLENFNGRLIFNEDVYTTIEYDWSCGEGCCSDTERESEKFLKGESIEVNRRFYPLSFERHPYNNPRFSLYEINELIEEGIITLETPLH